MPSFKRLLLVALMLVLLPLRGWVGNAMAVDMAAQRVMTAQAQTANAVPMLTDCALAMQVSTDSVKQVSQNSWHCPSCDTCQLCSALATASQVTWLVKPITRHNAVLLAGVAFESAESAFSFKPPIS